jgi:HPr kinase/phosphorylase
MRQLSVKQLHKDHGAGLNLQWLAAQESAAAISYEAAAAAALIGHLNLDHPNSIQVIGAHQQQAHNALSLAARTALAQKIFSSHPTAVIVADGVTISDELMQHAIDTSTPLFATPVPAAQIIETLSRYLSKSLADTTTRHGVFMDVLGLGVMITGESGVGKSELGLELISRGHGLVADDVVEVARIAANTLEGRCPAVLRDFIEVRGLGLLNVRTIFGETAVRPKMRLKLIVQLAKSSSGGPEIERLPLEDLSEEILGVVIRKVVIPVAAGRNLAVLLEAAVRNHILRLRGIDSTAEFMARQSNAIELDEDDEID